MTPIDDELRSALSSRTASFTPSPDLFAGIERRAVRMRRRRVAGAVAGSALAVSALGLGGPLVVSSLTSSAPAPGDLATTAPTLAPEPEVSYALDPADPWPYRGDEQVRVQGDVDAYEVEWAARHGQSTDAVDLVPLFGQVHEPSGVPELVFLVRGAAEGDWWGVARASEGGPELVVDQPLAPGTSALAAALPGDEVSRLLVVAAPTVADLEYAADDASEWSAMTAVDSGVAVAPLDGDAATDRYRVLSPEGEVLVDAPAPDGEVVEGEPEGPGTDTPPAVDPAPYRLDLDDPWAYRGPAELTQHPDLGSQDERLFVAGGTGRDDGSWSQQPLLAMEDEASGTSALMVLHRKGDLAVVTTTWQTQDEAPRQSEQEVQDGQLLVQTVLPDAGPAGVLIALASPEAGAVETDVAATGPAGATPGVLIAELPADPPAGSVFLYSEGDGLLYHSEPARRS